MPPSVTLSPTDGFLAGFERALFWFVDSTGAVLGTQSTLANGAASGAYVAIDVKTANAQPIDLNNIQVQGGDAIQAMIQFGNRKMNPFEMIVSNYDTNLVTLISGGSENTNNPYFPLVSENPARQTPRIMGIALQRRELLQTGQQVYATLMLPRCQVAIHQGAFGYQAEADTVISVAPLFTNVDALGFAFGTAGYNMALAYARADAYTIHSVNPIHIMAYRQDGAGSTFTTQYLPLSNIVTVNNTPNQWTVGGTAYQLTSVSTATGAVVTNGAGTAGNLSVLLYETAYSQ